MWRLHASGGKRDRAVRLQRRVGDRRGSRTQALVESTGSDGRADCSATLALPESQVSSYPYGPSSPNAGPLAHQPVQGSLDHHRTHSLTAPSHQYSVPDMQNPRCLDRMLTNLENDSKNSTHKNAATTFIEHLSGNSRPASGIQRAAFLRIAAVDPALINTSGRDAAQINRIVDGICDQLKIQRYAFERGARKARTKVDKRRKQTIDLLIELAGIVGDARDTIGECTQSYQGINTISTFQTRLGRALSKEDVKASVVPFLGFEREALNESINLTKEYVSRTQQAADTEHVRSAFSSAHQMLQAVLAAYDNAPTEFGSEIAATFRKISTDLDEHFSESPFGKTRFRRIARSSSSLSPAYAGS